MRAHFGYLWTRKTLLGELELSGDEEGRMNSSGLAVDVDSMTTGNKVVWGQERSLDSASNLCTLVADGDEEEAGGQIKQLQPFGGEYSGRICGLFSRACEKDERRNTAAGTGTGLGQYPWMALRTSHAEEALNEIQAS